MRIKLRLLFTIRKHILVYYFSFTPTVYKSSLVRTLIDHAFKINSSWKTFHLDLKRIKENLERNSFPIEFIDSRVKCYLDHKIGDTKNKKSEKTPCYFKLPYIGRYSIILIRSWSRSLKIYARKIFVLN